MKLALETDSMTHIYTLKRCSMPPGSYEATVLSDEQVEKDVAEGKVEEKAQKGFGLRFDTVAGDRVVFDFEYSVKAGQEDPKKVLEEQSRVHVDVVDHTRNAQRAPERQKHTKPQCLIEVADRELVPSNSMKRNLFDPQKFEKELWAHDIPLGQFGWIGVSATASGSLTGLLTASYGPGRLSDICLTYVVDKQKMDHPLLRGGSQTDVTTLGIGGRAHFRLPAHMKINIAGQGKLEIAGEALSLFKIAAATGVLTANGEAAFSGAIDGSVEILARATHTRTTPDETSAPPAITPENTTIGDLDLSAEVGLSGRASLMFSADVSASFKLLGLNLWSQSWKPDPFKSHVQWSGGLKYSPNPGIHWDLGVLGLDDEEVDDNPDRLSEHEDAADVHEDDIIGSLLNSRRAVIARPDGLSSSTALPFDWCKPIDLYPESLELPGANQIHDPHARPREDPKPAPRALPNAEPNAQPGADPAAAPDADPKPEPPQILSREGGVRTVEYYDSRHRLQSVRLGVSDWPAVGKTFRYTPYDPGDRKTPEQGRFNRMLDTLGYNRSGLDAEHVWDVKLRGLEYDRFSNLWPASNQDQQLAGSQHQRQIASYEQTLPRVPGRLFRIVRVVHPAYWP
jgi:hypothetical protein